MWRAIYRMPIPIPDLFLEKISGELTRESNVYITIIRVSATFNSVFVHWTFASDLTFVVQSKASFAIK